LAASDFAHQSFLTALCRTRLLPAKPVIAVPDAEVSYRQILLQKSAVIDECRSAIR
jgi:hypothetical protein